jgi:uncharacterized protein YcsI (UPF0317 family)
MEVKNIMKPNVSPQELRQLIRSRQWNTPTSGAASGCLQANLVMLPVEEAFNFYSSVSATLNPVRF